eukprot:6195978-Pleurochrysis_carterae.AAC.2
MVTGEGVMLPNARTCTSAARVHPCFAWWKPGGVGIAWIGAEVQWCWEESTRGVLERRSQREAWTCFKGERGRALV